MTGSRAVLLTPGTMGPAEWDDVSRRLTAAGHRVLVDSELTYDRGIMAAAGSQLERLRNPRFWTSTREAWRTVQAGLVAPFLMNRLTVNRAQVTPEADRRAADWASFAVGASVDVWLSAGNEALAAYLRGHGLDATVTPWGEAPWIRSAAELTAAIDDELQRSGTSE